MEIYRTKAWWKYGLGIFALLIICISIYYNSYLAKRLAEQERKFAKITASTLLEVNKQVTEGSKKNSDEAEGSNASNLQLDLGPSTLQLDIIQANTTIPIIITNENGDITLAKNLDESKIDQMKATCDTTYVDVGSIDENVRVERKMIVRGDSSYLLSMKATFEKNRPPIKMTIWKDKYQLLYFGESSTLQQLRWYPFIQFAIVACFILIAYWMFNAARRSEQNMVWLGMAKETAHQLGTPLTSLMGWMELLKINNDETSQMVGREMEKDVNRLKLISERFSKIGSKPELKEVDVAGNVERNVKYMKRRASQNIQFSYKIKGERPIIANVSETLFDWVIENLLKNALDAMTNKGAIDVYLEDRGEDILIDVKDTGKGIPKGQQRTVFQPGFSTKKRGWGLGLSLSKRIVEYYHKGKIFVHQSNVDEGTTFRIILPKAIPEKQNKQAPVESQNIAVPKI